MSRTALPDYNQPFAEEGLYWDLAILISRVFQQRGQPYDSSIDIYQDITGGSIRAALRYVQIALSELDRTMRLKQHDYRKALSLSTTYKHEADVRRLNPRTLTDADEDSEFFQRIYRLDMKHEEQTKKARNCTQTRQQFKNSKEDIINLCTLLGIPLEDKTPERWREKLAL